jgi:hypothetical protein
MPKSMQIQSRHVKFGGVCKGITRRAVFGFAAGATGTAILGRQLERRAAFARPMRSLNPRIIAVNIPGASAIAQVGTFLNDLKSLRRADPFPRIFRRSSSRTRCWIRSGYWSAAGRISALRQLMAQGRRGRCCRSTRTPRTSSASPPISRTAATRLRPSAAMCKGSAPTALIS